jgi:GNAT superfamily N-acetyltransferase
VYQRLAIPAQPGSRAFGQASRESPLTILEANLEDAEELARVEIESKSKSIPGLFSPIEIDFTRRLERWQSYLRGESFPQMAKPERVAFKACTGKRMIGYIAGHLTSRYGKDAEIESFYVLHEHQRVGIGVRLLQRYVEWGQRHQARSLCVGIAAKKPLPGLLSQVRRQAPEPTLDILGRSGRVGVATRAWSAAWPLPVSEVLRICDHGSAALTFLRCSQ